MFEPQTSSRVFALPLGVDFSRAFVDGLLERLSGQSPEALAKVVIYVNTRRSARGIEEILASSGARLLPDIRVVTDLARDRAISLPSPIPPLRRKLIIARLVSAFIDQQPDVAPQSAVFDLADSLGALLDSFQGEGLAMDALFSFTTAPIKLATRIGFAVLLVGAIYFSYILGRYYFIRDLLPGWGSLICTVLLLGGMQLIFVGMIGEYLARVFEEAKGRPLYFLKQSPDDD